MEYETYSDVVGPVKAFLLTREYKKDLDILMCCVHLLNDIDSHWGYIPRPEGVVKASKIIEDYINHKDITLLRNTL